jgi:hypothetical protein
MVKVNVIGFKELESKLKNLPVTLRKEVGAEIQFAGERFTELARKDVAKDTGQLAGSIRPVRTSELSVEVVVGKEYAPYVEWGTITRVQVPSELASYAAQFKGKGLRKNGGMYPRPFFFKQIPQVTKETIEHIENILTDL